MPSDLPRLGVDREQSERIAKVAILQGQRPDNTVVLNERPMMPADIRRQQEGAVMSEIEHYMEKAAAARADADALAALFDTEHAINVAAAERIVELVEKLAAEKALADRLGDVLAYLADQYGDTQELVWGVLAEHERMREARVVNAPPRLVLPRYHLDDRITINRTALVTLAERPTVPCPWRIHYGHDCPRCDGNGTIHKPIPIPVGTRVEVGWYEPVRPDPDRRLGWHPVATATVAEVKRNTQVTPGVSVAVLPGYAVTLTDIEAVT